MWWTIYKCDRCGGVVTAFGYNRGGMMEESYPRGRVVHEDVPERARTYLKQAMDSLHSPAGAVMLAASAVDAMLKAHGYAKGSLNSRIEKAAADHLLTPDMAKWAHEVRLDANDQRHADEEAPLPDQHDAKRSIEFAETLGTVLFVLPAQVKRGLSEPKAAPTPQRP